jgi:hypothetical protein
MLIQQHFKCAACLHGSARLHRRQEAVLMAPWQMQGKRHEAEKERQGSADTWTSHGKRQARAGSCPPPTAGEGSESYCCGSARSVHFYCGGFRHPGGLHPDAAHLALGFAQHIPSQCQGEHHKICWSKRCVCLIAAFAAPALGLNGSVTYVPVRMQAFPEFISQGKHFAFSCGKDFFADEESAELHHLYTRTAEPQSLQDLVNQARARTS